MRNNIYILSRCFSQNVYYHEFSKWIFSLTYILDIGYPLSNLNLVVKSRMLIHIIDNCITQIFLQSKPSYQPSH